MTGFLDNMRAYLKDLKDQELKKVIEDIPINELIEIWDDLDEEEELRTQLVELRERLEELHQKKPIHSVPAWYFEQEEELEERIAFLEERLENTRTGG